MSLDAAAFLVNRGGTNYFCQGQDLADRLQVGDKLLVQRNNQRFRPTYNGSDWNAIQDDDLLLAWDGSKNRKVTGENFKTLFRDPDPWLDAKFVHDETICNWTTTSHSIRFKLDYNPEIFDHPDSPTGQAKITYNTDVWYLDGVDQGNMSVSGVGPDIRWVAGTAANSAPTGAEIVGSITLRLVTVGGIGEVPFKTRRELSQPVLNPCTPITTADIEEATKEAQECHRLAYQEYQRCRLLCETDYCLSICERQFEEAVELCYSEAGLTAPVLLTPPPRP